jgi:hypothetical protein
MDSDPKAGNSSSRSEPAGRVDMNAGSGWSVAAEELLAGRSIWARLLVVIPIVLIMVGTIILILHNAFRVG